MEVKKTNKKSNAKDKKEPFVAKPENVRTINAPNTPKLKLVKNESNKIKLVITSACELKIRQLCNMFPDTEYSGFVFYTVKDMADDFTKGTIEAFDFFPMDIGSAGFTKFEYTPEVMQYMMQKGLMGKCQYGLLHSHHSMLTNPSGTDINTLNKEGEDRNHFLSIIVNNAGVYHAFLTRKLKVTNVGTIIEEYPSFNNVTKKVEVQINSVEEYVEYTELKILMAYPNAKELSERIKALKERNAQFSKQYNVRKDPPSLRTYMGTATKEKGYYGSLFPDSFGESHRFGEQPSERMWEESNKELEKAYTGDKVDLNKIILSNDREAYCRDFARDLFTNDETMSLSQAISLADEAYVNNEEAEYDLKKIVIDTFNENKDPKGSLAFGVMSVLIPYTNSYSIAMDIIDVISDVFDLNVIY